MKKILVTGFEPFGGESRNPSGDAVNLLPDMDGYEIRKRIVPVTWKTSFCKIEEVWDEWKPDALLMVGLAGGSKCIRVERYGLNLGEAIKDNDGLYPDGRPDSMAEVPLFPGDASGYFTTYNAKAVLDALKEEEIPAKYSFSAGAYICNNLIYSALHKQDREHTDLKIGFIHLPYAEGQHEDKPTMKMEMMVKALTLTLDHMWN